jgi:hypothetical protein
MLLSSSLPPLCNDGYRPRNRPTLPRPCLQMVRITRQGYQRSRPSIHIPLWQEPSPLFGNWSEPVISVPPSNRQDIRKEKPMGQAISMIGYIHIPRRLDSLVGDSHSDAQQSKEWDYQVIAQSNPSRIWINTTFRRGHSIKQWGCGDLSPECDKKKRTSHWHHQPNRMDQANTDVTAQTRRSSLAKSNPPKDLPSENEAQAQMIWTFQDYQRDLPCGVSAEAPHGMRNPQCFPHITLIILSWNNHPQPKFLPTFIRATVIDGEEEYQVECIMGHRRAEHVKKLQYLVKWLGYPNSDNTWEPESQVHASNLIMEYQC